ncbi:erythrocyte binding like protein [Plasmodium yoelii]|uniref:Erythrocyte-binding-like protein n=3 Tax=Plasmodium yoelii TaxID=5861 RepID=B5U9X5_PLAYO|nr:erythrocyte binding like protein [Plasmodium yoelii]BAG71923.1 erythrocyte-binding-like protein [Plasmodium yoelii yoelii]VTZ80752.1 erythrocyte binding like protein [Plasmodium yoelii]|eukprot:XP_022813630.1 erythrocyte binding like protein [Plasmodium yoelii]
MNKIITYFSFILLMQYSLITCNHDKKIVNLLKRTYESFQSFPLKNNSGNRILYELKESLYNIENGETWGDLVSKDNEIFGGKDHILSENYTSDSVNSKKESNFLETGKISLVEKNGNVNYKDYFDKYQVNECKEKNKNEIHAWICDNEKQNCIPSRRINLCTKRLEIIPDTIKIPDNKTKELLMDYFKQFIYKDAAREGELLLNKYDDKNNNEYCNDMINSFGDYKNIVEGTGLKNVANESLLELKIQNIFGTDDNAKRNRKTWWKNHEHIVWKAMVLGKNFNETSNYKNVCTNYKLEDYHSQIERWTREWIQEFSVQYFKEANKINNKCTKKSNISTESICINNECKNACNTYEAWISVNKSKWDTLLQRFSQFNKSYFSEETCRDKAYNSLMIEFKEAYEANFENVINLDDDHYTGLCVCSSVKPSNTPINNNLGYKQTLETQNPTDASQNTLFPPFSTGTETDLFKEDDDDNGGFDLLSYNNADAQNLRNSTPTDQVGVNNEQNKLNQNAESNNKYELQIMGNHANSDNTYHNIIIPSQENNIYTSTPESVTINPTSTSNTNENQTLTPNSTLTPTLTSNSNPTQIPTQPQPQFPIPPQPQFPIPPETQFPIPPETQIPTPTLNPNATNKGVKEHHFNTNGIENGNTMKDQMNIPPIKFNIDPKHDNTINGGFSRINNDNDSENANKLGIDEYEHRDIKKSRENIIMLANENVCNGNPGLKYCESINNKYFHGTCSKSQTQNLCCSISNYCIKFFNINSKKYYDCMNEEFMAPDYNCFQKESYSNQYYYATGGIIFVIIFICASIGFSGNKSEEEAFNNYEEYLYKSYNQSTLNNGFKRVQEYIPVDFY